MRINYGEYFNELGFKEAYYNKENNVYDKDAIIQAINKIEDEWKEKYPQFNFKTEKLKFDNQVAFNQSFTTEIEYLNLETKWITDVNGIADVDGWPRNESRAKWDVK